MIDDTGYCCWCHVTIAKVRNNNNVIIALWTLHDKLYGIVWNLPLSYLFDYLNCEFWKFLAAELTIFAPNTHIWHHFEYQFSFALFTFCHHKCQGWAAGRLSLHDRIHMTSLGWNEVTYCALLNLDYWVFLIVHSQVTKLWLSCCLVLHQLMARPGSGTAAFSWPDPHIVFPRWCEWDGCWETSTHQFS